MNFMSDFQKLKEKSGKSTREIADACELSESTVNRYLCGKSIPPVDTAQKILNYLEESTLEETPIPERSPEPKLPEELPEPEKPKVETITLPVWAYQQMISRNQKMLDDLRADHEKTMQHIRRQQSALFGTILFLVAVIVYLVLDASHGGWGIFQYSNFFTAGLF